MKLHLDRSAFGVLLDAVHLQSGIREDVLEKDYYVTLVLKELSVKQQEGLPAYFKGGTALYKALKMINRFSEDIDLILDWRILGYGIQKTLISPSIHGNATNHKVTKDWKMLLKSIPCCPETAKKEEPTNRRL